MEKNKLLGETAFATELLAIKPAITNNIDVMNGAFDFGREKFM